jgi:hypothetical protein
MIHAGSIIETFMLNYLVATRYLIPYKTGLTLSGNQTYTSMSRKEMLEQLKCIQIDLKEYFNPAKLAVLKAVESYIKNGSIDNRSSEKTSALKKSHSKARVTKRQLYNKYFNK